MTMRVVVAEDDTDLLDVVVLYLEQLGLIVSRANNGVSLIDLLTHREPFDLIITDISMPWMNGIQVAQRAREVGIETPVIIMTGRARADVIEQTRSLGSSTMVLQKPFEMDRIKTAIETLLPGRLEA